MLKYDFNKVAKVKKYKSLTQSKFYLNHLQFSNVSTDTKVILKENWRWFK